MTMFKWLVGLTVKDPEMTARLSSGTLVPPNDWAKHALEMREKGYLYRADTDEWIKDPYWKPKEEPTVSPAVKDMKTLPEAGEDTPMSRIAARIRKQTEVRQLQEQMEAHKRKLEQELADAEALEKTYEGNATFGAF